MVQFRKERKAPEIKKVDYPIRQEKFCTGKIVESLENVVALTSDSEHRKKNIR